MGLSKTDEFTRTENDLASLAKALGHPARIAILRYLADKKTCICGDIVEELPLSQSTVSQHLAELKRAGLIKGNIDGPRVCYCIDEKTWARARRLMTELFDEFPDPSCC